MFCIRVLFSWMEQWDVALVRAPQRQNNRLRIDSWVPAQLLFLEDGEGFVDSCPYEADANCSEEKIMYFNIFYKMCKGFIYLSHQS